MPLALIAAASIAVGGESGWATFSAYYNRAWKAVEVSIGTADPSEKPVVYSFKRTTKTLGENARIDQVDTRTCPRLLTALRDLRALPAPQPSPPFLDSDEITVTADGVSYSLTVPAAYGDNSPDDMTLKSNTGTPLASWIEQTLASFEECAARR
jgi:hypothetical protein